MTTWGSGLTLEALDAAGRRIAGCDAAAELDYLVLREAMGIRGSSDVAAFELNEDGRPHQLLPVVRGARAVQDEVNRRVRRHLKRRGPIPTGPDPGMERLITTAADFWFGNTRPPTQQQLNDALGASSYGTLRNLVAALDEPWWQFLLKVKTFLTSIELDMLPGLDPGRQRKAWEWFGECFAWDVAGENDLLGRSTPRPKPVRHPGAYGALRRGD